MAFSTIQTLLPSSQSSKPPAMELSTAAKFDFLMLLCKKLDILQWLRLVNHHRILTWSFSQHGFSLSLRNVCLPVPRALMVLVLIQFSFREKVWLVYKATRQHARNLASFAVVYKSCMLLLRYMDPTPGGKEGPFDTFWAGLIGGYTVFGRGRQGSVSQQV